MRRTALLALVALSLSGCASLLDTAAATVNGRKIQEERFAKQLDFLLADPRFAEQVPEGDEGEEQRKELARQFLTFMIHQEVVRTYAEGEGIDVPSDEVDALLEQQVGELGGREPFGQVLAQAGISEGDVRELLSEQVLRRAVAEDVVAQEVSEEQLRATYEERLLEFSQIHTAHILVETEQEARDLLARATPESFGDLARQFSTDTSSAPNGGDLGPQRAVDLLEPYSRAALEIPIGEIGGPVATEFGFHLIHVIDRQTIPFEQARPDLLEELTGEVFTNWLLERVRTAEVRVNPRYGHFDESSGSVVERTSSTPLPAPSVQLQP